MPESTDAELLRRFVESSSQEAFRELVGRHIGFVYGTAVRKARGTHRAEDVTQEVFTDLARKAGMLVGRGELVGWLYTATHFASAKLIRTEVRRERREQEAQQMHELTSDTASAIEWNRILPILDEALQDLTETDRGAILLRFFKDKSFAEIAASLRLTDEAARKRVSRALDQLNASLSRRGLTSTAAALAAALQAQPVLAVPAGLTAGICSAALGAAGVGVGAAAAGILDGALKVKFLVPAAAALGIAFTWVEIEQTNAAILPTATQLVAASVSKPSAGARSPVPGSAPAFAGPPAGRPSPQSSTVAAPAEIRDPLAGMTFPTPPLAPDQLRNAGFSNPADALTTVVWARRDRNLEALASGIGFTSTGRPRAQDILDRLPPELRARFPDIEHFWAAHLLASPNPFLDSTIRILGRTVVEADKVALSIGLRPVGAEGPGRLASFEFKEDSAKNWRQGILDYDLILWNRQRNELAAELTQFLDNPGAPR